MSLVEKVYYLKKKMGNLPKEKKDRKPSESFALNQVQMDRQILPIRTLITRMLMLDK